MLSRSKKFVLILSAVLFIAGCGYREGVIQRDQKSFFWFTGDIRHAVVTIDDNEPFEVKEGLVHYQVPPGKHRVVVKKGGRVVVNRILMLDNGVTREIEIP